MIEGLLKLSTKWCQPSFRSFTALEAVAISGEFFNRDETIGFEVCGVTPSLAYVVA